MKSMRQKAAKRVSAWARDGQSVEAIAARLDVGAATVSRWISGARLPQTGTARRILAMP